MMQYNGIGKKILVCVFYVVSLLPLVLPWCYFEEEVDGMKCGLDIINHAVLLILAFATLLSILLVGNERGRRITKILLVIHSAIYLVYALFWYVPLLTDFDLLLSLEAAHCGFYLSLVCNGLLYFFYTKVVSRE